MKLILQGQKFKKYIYKRVLKTDSTIYYVMKHMKTWTRNIVKRLLKDKPLLHTH